MFMCDVTKTQLTRVILFTVNYCLFANGDVSIRFIEKDDNVVLELWILSRLQFCKANSQQNMKYVKQIFIAI